MCGVCVYMMRRGLESDDALLQVHARAYFKEDSYACLAVFGLFNFFKGKKMAETFSRRW